MKKISAVVLTLFITLFLFGCVSEKENEDVDVDLTQLSSTMVYSEVYNMLSTPENYIGKTVKMTGEFQIYRAVDANGYVISDNIYYACVIADATACCQQGIEFILSEGEYPEEGEVITVMGEFQTYLEDDLQYCHLINATMIK